MSYSFGFSVVQDGDVKEACLGAFDTIKQNISSDYAGEVAEHVQTIAEGVSTIIGSGALGIGRTVSVSISGHAEPDHIKRDGYSQDFISIQLSQVQEPESA